MEFDDATVSIVIDALGDAIEYQTQQGASSPCRCAEHGAECDDCMPYWAAADTYAAVYDALIEHADPPARDEQDVPVRDELL